RYRIAQPGTRVRCESREIEQLMPRLVEGALDLVLQPDAPRAADIAHRQVGSLNLVMVATRPGVSFADALRGNYIELEWGSAFGSAQTAFMEGRHAALRMDAMHLAVAWLRGNEGSAYLPEDIVQRE